MSDYKYCWGFTRHEMTNLSDSISDCIKEAKEMKGLDFVPRFIYIGEGKTYQPNIGFGYHILECYGEEAEYCDSNWLEDVSDEDEALLDEMISEAFKKWCKKTGNEPNFGTIENIKKYSLDTGKEIK